MVIMPAPRAFPGRYRYVARLDATAYAAIDAVPRVETRLCSKILPKLKRPLSTLLGIPMARIFRMMPESGFSCERLPIRIRCPKRWRQKTINNAAAILAISVGRATPSTPMWRPKIQIALPIILRTFIPRDTSMANLVLPSARKIAAAE